MNRKKTEILAKLTLNYLEKNPDAGDTLEGIAGWWLEQEKIDNTVEEVAKALNLLLKKGLISVFESKSCKKIYKVKNK